MRYRLLVAAGLICGATMSTYGQGRQPVTHGALWLMPRVGAPVVSPDGKWVVVSVVQPAYDEKDQTSDLWAVPTDGSAAPRRLTSTKASESGVAWSADSRRIAFATKREGDDANQMTPWISQAAAKRFASRQSRPAPAPLPGVQMATRCSSRVSSTRTPPTRRQTRESPRSARIKGQGAGGTIASPSVTGIAGSTIVISTCSCSRSRRAAKRAISSPARSSCRAPATAGAGSTRAKSSTPCGRPTAPPSSSPRRRTRTRRPIPRCTRICIRLPRRAANRSN